MAERVGFAPSHVIGNTDSAASCLPPNPLEPHESLGRRTYSARGSVYPYMATTDSRRGLATGGRPSTRPRWRPRGSLPTWRTCLSRSARADVALHAGHGHVFLHHEVRAPRVLRQDDSPGDARLIDPLVWRSIAPSSCLCISSGGPRSRDASDLRQHFHRHAT